MKTEEYKNLKMCKEGEHLFNYSNTWTAGWSGENGTLTCIKCLAVAKVFRQNNEVGWEIEEIIPAKIKQNQKGK